MRTARSWRNTGWTRSKKSRDRGDLTRRLNIWLLSVLLIVGIPYYWFLVDAGAGPGLAAARARPVTMAQLRALARAIEGPRPTELRVETIGLRMTSHNMLVAGAGLRATQNMVRAYELAIPGAGPVVIDAGITRAAAIAHDFVTYDVGAQARVDFAVARAEPLVILSDRPTHNGGDSGRRTGGGQFGDLPIPGGAPYAVAPGVVVIPATGLTPGTNMVYAQMANDREYLFVGDVAKLTASWRENRLPARFATRTAPVRFRHENLSWLMTINALHRAAPQMVIVAGHEPGAIPFSAGTFSD